MTKRRIQCMNSDFFDDNDYDATNTLLYKLLKMCAAAHFQSESMRAMDCFLPTTAILLKVKPCYVLERIMMQDNIAPNRVNLADTSAGSYKKCIGKKSNRAR